MIGISMPHKKKDGGGKVRKGSFREDEMISLIFAIFEGRIETSGVHDGCPPLVNHMTAENGGCSCRVRKVYGKLDSHSSAKA